MNARRVPKPAAVVALFALALTPTFAPAVPLPDPIPPATFVDVPISGTTTAARPELAGVVLEDVLKPYFFVSGDATLAVAGQIQNRVVRSTVDGTLDFYWRIIPEAHPLLAPANPLTQDGDVIAFRVTGFGDFALDADFGTDGVGNIGPNIARHFGGGSVNFLFDPGVGYPEHVSSYFFFLDTQATQYAEVGRYDMLGAPTNFISTIYTTFAPIIPEPATALLLAVALFFVAPHRIRTRS